MSFDEAQTREEIRQHLISEIDGYWSASAQFAQKMSEKIDAQDSLAACRWLHRVNQNLLEVATHLVEVAIREGHSQREIADALGVPPSALRGAKQQILGTD